MEDFISQLPSPLQIIIDPISLIILAMYAGLMVWEEIAPARQLPKIRFWRLKGMISFTVFFFVSSYLPIWIDPLISQYMLFDLSGIGTLGGVIVGVLSYQLVFYIYHRSVHKIDSLWRTFHQMHHSAERVDTYGAFFFSPAEMISFTFLGSFVFAFLMGLPPQAITTIILLLNFLSIFQHANIRTPRWLGYIIQRPESHSFHHGKGLHKGNYSDLPIWDILFGTFKNPNDYEHETGFYHGASNRIMDMMLFRDVSRTPLKRKIKQRRP